MVKKIVKFYLVLCLCTLGVALSHTSVVAMSPIDTYPMADWLMISGGNKDQNAKACLVARDFDAGVMLAITQKAGGGISLGFNFRKDMLTLNKTHYIALSTDTGYNKLYQINATSMRELILDLNSSQPNENPLVGAREIYMNIQGLHSYKFNIPDINQGLDKLNSCSANLPAQPSLAPAAIKDENPGTTAPNDPPALSPGITPHSFHNVLDNLTTKKTAPVVKIPVSPSLQRQKIEATPVFEGSTQQKPAAVVTTPPPPPSPTVTVSPAKVPSPPLKNQKIEATPVMDSPVEKKPAPAPISNDEFSYTPPAFFSPEVAKANLDKADENTPKKAADVKLPVPDSIEEMSQKMQDIKDGKLPPIPEPAAISTQEATPATEEEVVEDIVRYDPLTQEESEEEDGNADDIAEANDTELSPPSPSPREKETVSNESLDPELVESLVQKIKLLEVEKESLRTRLHEYEIDNKILRQITPPKDDE